MGIWELDRAHVLAATFVLLLQAALIAVLLLQRKRRLRAERARVEAAERLSLATRSAALGIWQWKVATGEVECSAECKRMLGFLAEARVSQGAFLGRVHPSEREAVETALDEALLGLGPCDVQFRVI